MTVEGHQRYADVAIRAKLIDQVCFKRSGESGLDNLADAREVRWQFVSNDHDRTYPGSTSVARWPTGTPSTRMTSPSAWPVRSTRIL